jgi:hypothetical protein
MLLSLNPRTLDEKIEKLTAQATADAKAAEARSAVAEIATPKIGGFKVTKRITDLFT